MNPISIAFTGPSGSGKTTTILRIAEQLTKDYRLAIVKHDPSDKAQFDKEGKDSWKFSQTGAEIVVTSPTRTTYLSQRPREIENIIEMLAEFDILIVEGLKTLPLPRIAIFRNEIDISYFSCSDAIAIDDTINIADYDVPQSLKILDLNNTQQLIDWLLENGQAVVR
ncbi:molybdopterin-guanine dinucleotide biosynthesis protein B [Vibrio sp. RC27]